MIFSAVNKDKLIEILNNLPDDIYYHLDSIKIKGQNLLNRGDFLWFHILRIFAFMGSFSRYEILVENEKIYKTIKYEALLHLDDMKIFHYLIESAFKNSNINITQERINLLINNYEKINVLGGLKNANYKALSSIGYKNKLKFIKQFDGIGYAFGMKIWMDCYDEDFHNQILINESIQKISKLMGYKFSNEKDEILFYQSIAKSTNLQLWEVDRLLNDFNDIFLNKLVSF